MKHGQCRRDRNIAFHLSPLHKFHNIIQRIPLWSCRRTSRWHLRTVHHYCSGVEWSSCLKANCKGTVGTRALLFIFIARPWSNIMPSSLWFTYQHHNMLHWIPLHSCTSRYWCHPHRMHRLRMSGSRSHRCLKENHTGAARTVNFIHASTLSLWSNMLLSLCFSYKGTVQTDSGNSSPLVYFHSTTFK